MKILLLHLILMWAFMSLTVGIYGASIIFGDLPNSKEIFIPFALKALFIGFIFAVIYTFIAYVERLG